MRALKFALIQTATHWHDPAANREMFSAWLDRVEADTDVAVLPEMFSTGFTMASADVAETMDGPTVTWMREEAARRGVVLCGSAVVEADGRYFNRFLWVTPDGAATPYDKRHLFRMAGEHEHYSAGVTPVVCGLDGWRIRPLVCYDLRFPVWLRNTSPHGYDVLLCVANWPKTRSFAWDNLLSARAIENQAYVVAVNILGTDGNAVEYEGRSAVYGPEGQRLAELGETSGVMHVVLEHAPLLQLRETFPVWQDADSFELGDKSETRSE